MYKWAKDLKAGDKVVISPRTGSRYISKVKRMTKTLIITENGSRFSKKWLRVPGNSWSPTSIMKWTQELEYAIKLKKKKKVLIQLIDINLKKIDFTKMEIEQLENFLSNVRLLGEKCEFYPHPREETCVCGCGSDVSDSFVCTPEYSQSCQWANQKRKEDKENETN